MTVCIAAITNEGCIVGVSDRMLSTDQMKFEPAGTTKKIFCLSPVINALNAGHDAIQAEIMQAMQAQYNSEKQENPKREYTVKDMVGRYVNHYNEVRNKRLDAEVFSVWGLNATTFLARQREFADMFIRDLTDQVTRFQMPETATIIAGIDTSTGQMEPHIYRIRRGGYYNNEDCCNAVGYIAIGVGQIHADVQFMRANYTRDFSVSKVVFLAYMAKRRSEIAPGVGRQTDMFVIGSKPKINKNLDGIVDYKKLDELYDKITVAENGVYLEAHGEVIDMMLGKI